MRRGEAHFVGQLHRGAPGDAWTFDGDLNVAHRDPELAWRAIRDAMAAGGLVLDPICEREALDTR